MSTFSGDYFFMASRDGPNSINYLTAAGHDVTQPLHGPDCYLRFTDAISTARIVWLSRYRRHLLVVAASNVIRIAISI